MKIKILFLVISVIILLVGFFIASPETFGYCCISSNIQSDVGGGLFFGVMPVIILFIISLFIKNKEKTDLIYKSFIVYLILSIGAIKYLPSDCNVLSGLLCILYKGPMLMFLGVLFLVVGSIIFLKRNTN